MRAHRIAVVSVLAACAIAGASAALAATQGHAAASGYSVRIAPVTQDSGANCAPAVSSMLLSAFGIHAGQNHLAAQMQTSENGTPAQNAIGILDDYLTRRQLQVAWSARPAQLAEVLTAQIRSGHPVVLEVQAQILPWLAGMHAPSAVHWVLATGIQGQAVSLFDPDTHAWHGGWHTIPVSGLSAKLLLRIYTLVPR